MTQGIQDTLLQLFEQVRLDPDAPPPVLLGGWQEGSAEWQLLKSFCGMAEQVQERIQQLKQAEEQLREREEQYRSIFEATTDGMVIASLEDGVIVEVNPAECNMFGYTYEEMIGGPPSLTVHPDSLPLVADALQTIQAGEQFHAQSIALRKDGISFPVETLASPFTYKGKPHLLAVTRDISERVEAERQLREKEEQYRSIFEAVTDSLSIARLEDGQIVEVNPAQCKMFGYTYEEMIGLTPADLVHPDSLPLVAEGLEQFRAEGRSDPPQMKLLRKDGTSFLNEAHSTRFIYKGEPHLLTVSRDITERVEAERQLREREEQYRSVFEATSDGLDILDLGGFIVEVNPAFCQIYGYSREELIGMNVNALVPPISYSIAVEGLETLKAGRDYKVTTDAQGLRKDGTTFSAEAHGIPFTYRGQRHILGVVRDITERVEAERQLSEKEEQYRSIFEANTDGLMIGDLEEGYVVEANPAACQMYGYSYEEFIGLGPNDITPLEYQHLPGEARSIIKEGGQFQAQGVIALRKEGSTFYVDAHTTPFTYKGKLHQLAAVRDVTERVEAEKQLREKEAQYRSIFEATYDALFIMDLDGFLVEVNPAFCRMFGYPYEEVIGLHASGFAAPVSLPSLAESLKALNAGRDIQTQVGQGLRKDGTVFYNEAHSTTFTYRGKPHALGVVRDVTERIEAEQQLREKEEQYGGIFEATTDAMFITTLAGVVVEANPAACKMLGYTYEEVIGLSPAAIAHPDYHSEAAENLRIHQAGGDAAGNMVLMRKDGATLPTEGRSTIFTYKGRPHVLAVLRDITERVEAERQLREREEQYRSIFESTYDGLAITTIDGFVVEVNPAFCRMFGYPYEEAIGLHASTFTGPASLPTLSDALEMYKAGRGTQTVVGQALRRDGATFFTESYATILTFQGQPHALAVSRDITERIQAEQELREREEQYRSIFESTYDAINIIDLDGYFVEVNPAFCRMFGYSRDELIGMHASATTAPETLPVLDDALNTFKAGGDYQTVVARGVRKDGTPFYAESHGTTLTYRGKPHALSVSRDVTERVEAERQLREREEQYRGVFEATYDALVVMDRDGYFVEVNPAFCRMFGYTREELIGQHGSITTPPETLPVLDDFLHSIKTHTNYQVPAGARGVRKDGTVLDTESHATTVTYQGKSHVLGVIRDITEQVQAQQLLEQRVEERTRELASLLSISHTVASTLHLKPLVGLILDQLKTVVDYTGAAILTVEGDDLVVLDSRSPTPQEQLQQIHLLPQRLGPIWEAIASGEAILMPDQHDETSLAQTLRAGMGGLMDTTFSYVRASLFVPLTLQDRVIGMLALTSGEADAFTQHHATLAQAVANQAAIAIENARLYAQAQELAALEERQKLARELHDSVSQALYGISLGAHAARTALERDPDGVGEPLDYVLSLAEAALAEMRALIFELRPESLETEGLVSALTKQAAALQARHELVVSTGLCDEPDLPLPVKQELYRIAQEAMHNTVKHAHASQVVLRLEQAGDEVVLEVRDDGVGFDPSASFPGHLGLHSMRERVTYLGGIFEIESAQGAGTRVRVRIAGHP